MPGMGGSLHINLLNQTTVSTFDHRVYTVALLQILAVGLVLFFTAVLSGGLARFNVSPLGESEPAARSVLRYTFGAIWVFDGLLQFQPGMPLGLGSSVLAPAAAGNPSWLVSLVHHAVNLWNLHPIALAAAVAWWQVGLGVVIIVSNGLVGRLAGGVSALWAIIVWVVGNAMGGIFQSTSSILFGWPGATIWYALAGAALALSPAYFGRVFSRVVLRFTAVVLALGALQQLRPSVGFWHGGNANALTTMANSMVASAQPHWLASLVREGGVLAGSMGGGFNTLVVLWLLVAAGGLWISSRRGWMWPIWTTVAFALVFWVLGQDMAIFGGLATDLNSLPPMAALVLIGSPRLAARAPLRRRLPREVRSQTGAVIASFAASMMVVSGISMVVAPLATAEPTYYLAANGSTTVINAPAPNFSLTDQFGQRVGLTPSGGTWTLLSFLDPVCYTDCPLLAAQMRAVLVGAHSAHLRAIAVAANPKFHSTAEVQHFAQIHGMDSIANFHYLNGTTAQLRRVWDSYGITVYNVPKSVMSVHADYLFLISPTGRIRVVLGDDPGSGTIYQQQSTEQVVLNYLSHFGVI
jgi:cytochrome oxidase Cu insertion factor (SCO1/SenC/PrrC family)